MRATETKVPPAVLDVLRSCNVQQTGIAAPPLDRKLYQQYNQVLERVGGKWDKKTKSHIFAEADDVRGVIAELLATGEVPHKNPDAFFESTPVVVQRLIELADFQSVFPDCYTLEPSAGTGVLADAIIAQRSSWLECVEAHPGRAAALKKKGYTVAEQDFLTIEPEQRFDRVVMNPPFAVPGNPLAYVDHVLHASRFLAVGGRLLAVVPLGVQFRTDAKTARLRALVEAHGKFHELPADAFKESGTGVKTCIAQIDVSPTALLPLK